MIEAAGGAIWRRDANGDLEIIVIHRPRYDDWSLPKGKLEPGEDAETAALRETREETGLECTLGAPLPSVRYTDRKGRPKRVRYWAMRPGDEGRLDDFEPNREVDQVSWVKAGESLNLLTYDHDREVIKALTTHVAADDDGRGRRDT